MCCCSIATIIYLHTMIYAATATDIGSMGLYGAGIPKNLYIYIYHSNNKYKYRYIHTYIHIYVCTFLHWTLYIYIYILWFESVSLLDSRSSISVAIYHNSRLLWIGRLAETTQSWLLPTNVLVRSDRIEYGFEESLQWRKDDLLNRMVSGASDWIFQF